MRPPKLRGVTPEIFATRMEAVQGSDIAREGDLGHHPIEPVSPEIWAHAESIARRLVDLGAPWPFLYPSNEGGAQLEWDAGSWAISLEVDPDGAVRIDATDCGPGGQSHDAETSIDGAADALVGVLRLAGIAWGGA